MVNNEQILINLKTAVIKKYPCFVSQLANTNFYFNSELEFHTAATDGNNIFFDPHYIASLSENDKLFVVAHELMHIKFQHMFRLKNSDGSLKNLHLWNIATDAIINANLEQDGFFADGVTPNDKFINITKEKDIDNISITRLGSGTNFDVAVREFSNNQSINKIIFTDGWHGKMPAEDTKRINVIWLVYENKNFAPCCGKVINVQPKKIIDTQTKAVTQQNININENTR